MYATKKNKSTQINSPLNENTTSFSHEDVVEELEDVSTNLPKYQLLVQNLISTIRIFSEQDITPEAEEELLSKKVRPLTKWMRTELSQYNDVFNVDIKYAFKDLAKNAQGQNDLYEYDKRRSIILARELTRIFGEKKVSFSLPSCKVNGLELRPVTSTEYASGLPFLLSCVPNFCDFVGGFGGNYPAAEYMTDKATSIKIYNQGKYVGHFNLWMTREGDFIIGTIAVPRNTKIKNFGEKFKSVLYQFAIDLMMANPETNNLYIGLGGANMSTLNQSSFGFSEEKNSGYELVKSIRHLDSFDNEDGSENEHVTQFKQISGFNVVSDIKLYENNPGINDEYYMGMSADDRKDFKNAIVFANREVIPSLQDILKKINEGTENKPRQKTNAEIKAERAKKWDKNRV